MSSYVSIGSSPGEIIRIAVALSSRGRELTGVVDGITDNLRTAESHPEVFPPDQFTANFKPVYEQPVEDSTGNAVAANLAVRKSAKDLGEMLEQIGNTVNQAMTNYQATDDDSGDSIAATV